MPTPQPPHPLSNPDDLLAQMTLEQKVGQVLLVCFNGTALTPDSRAEIIELHVGGVIFLDHNIESPAQLAQLADDLQQAARANGSPALFMAIDQEGGTVTRLKDEKGFTEFPGAMAIAATGDVENARRIARAMSAELRAVGINLDLAPDLDVNNNSQNPVIGTRSFGSDPTRVAEFGIAFIQAMQDAGIAAVGKHFPGHGDTALDSHHSLPTVPHDRARLESVEFVPFRAAIKAQVAGIMSAHITFPAIDSTPGLPATLSRKVLTDLLRREMQYDGLIMTDELTMGAVATSGFPPPQAAAAALAAGADMLLLQTGFGMHQQVRQELIARVQRGDIPRARLDDAVHRVLLAKARFGILSGTESRTPDRVGAPETKSLAREIAAQSITLVRDDPGLVPIRLGAPILVVETRAFGLGKRLHAATVLVAEQPTPNEIAAVVEAGKETGAALVATSDVAKNRQQAELVHALQQAHVPIILIAMRSPYDTLYLKDASTLLAIYGASPPTLDALIDILTGKIKPQGRLPVHQMSSSA
ncbi:MAG: beta-N-acetylhexosaminidase [Chloroflexi bacterium]|nr:beta-N-acetylhexosaminidase [Chloroflexota bacterium]